MNSTLQQFVSGNTLLNRTLAQAQKLIVQGQPILNAEGVTVLGLFAVASAAQGGAAQGAGPDGSVTLAQLQADPFDLGTSDAIHFLLGVNVNGTVKLIDVGPALDNLNNTGSQGGTNTQPTTRIEKFLGQIVGGTANPAMLSYTAIAKSPFCQAAIASAFGLPN